MPFTFTVDPVQIRKKKLEVATLEELLQTATSSHNAEHVNIQKMGVSLQDSQYSDMSLVSRSHKDMNVFLETLHLAYQNHYPVSISPDHIWILITSGLAMHVNHGDNAEKLRKEFVQFDGKKQIEIKRQDFSFRNPNNDWNEVIGQFSTEICKHIGKKTHDLIVSNFSTTGLIEKTVSEIVLMECMENYFKYVVSTDCGIPSITLEGTVEDWKSIKSRAKKLEEFGLSWWVQHLEPLLDLFISAYQGNPDQKWWREIYKWIDCSGDECITGWITDFFPYLSQGKKNTRLGHWKYANERGVFNSSYIPKTLSKAPVKFYCNGEEDNLYFCGGFIGTSQNIKTYTLRPVLGWAVTNVDASNNEVLIWGGTGKPENKPSSFGCCIH